VLILALRTARAALLFDLALAPACWAGQTAARGPMSGTEFQVPTEYIPDSQSLEYMIFPRACALAEVAWSGGPVPLTTKA
jgi:hexosaminidase